jgi:uncharacterized protein involved in exopolysaccharide biosynthesis
MAPVNAPPGLPLWSDYTRFARRHALLIAGFMLAGILIGFVWALQQPSTYSATASVALTPVPKYLVPSTTELVAPEVTVDTDAQLLQSPEVLGAVGEALGVDQDVASEHLSVTASANSHVLHVTVQAATPQRAAAAANAAVAALVGVRRNVLGSLQESQLGQLRLLISTQERAFTKEQAKRVIFPDTDDLWGQILLLRSELDELEEATAQPARVVAPAVPPVKPDYANTEVGIVSGMMLGLLAACALGATLDRVPELTGAASSAHRLAHRTFRPLTLPTNTHEDRHVV